MFKVIQILTFCGLFATSALAQLKYEGFNSVIPANWSTTSGSSMLLSSDHFKGGNKSLRWTAVSGGQINVSGLGISSTDIGSTTASSAQFFIYSKNISNDTLVFQFLDGSGIVRREGRMLLNYKGWRDYHRSYRYDYNNGNESTAFALNQCRIIYKPAQGNTTNTIWFDEMTFVGNTEARFPGPHMLLDVEHFQQTASTAGGDSKLHLRNWGLGPDLPVTPATSAELAGLQAVKTAYNRTIPTVTAANLQAAKTYVINSGITRNSDNSIKGRAITALVNQDTLVMLANHCGSLARAAIRNNDTDAKNKLLLFTEYLLDQGLAEGGRIVITSNTYENSRTFPNGFLEALSLYPAAMRAEVLKMLKWSVEYSRINTPDYIVRLNIDYIHVKSNFLFEIAVADPSNDVAVRDLKCVKRFFELNTDIGDGGRDGIKPDGIGVHHQSHHMSYLYAFGTWIDRIYPLKGTPFKITKQAYENMRFAIKTLFLETSKGTLYPHSVSGRGPFPSSVPVSAAQVRKLVEIGGDIIGAPFEPDLAAFYNYMFAATTYSVPAKSYDGFHQFNYAQLGVLRKGNWTAAMRGFTDKVFGSEIYADQNSYGRYQSYGTLEVLYNGQLASTGYISRGNGWDWNVIPGTTTVHLPFNSLRPTTNGTRTEYQLSGFAGALALGKNGVFGMDFIQNAGTRYPTSNLTFRKSVFSFGDFMVCLGTNINTSNTLGNVATNLFQGITTGTNPNIYINSTTPTSAATYSNSISLSNEDLWIVNGQTTGYYIPKGNGNVTIIRGSQTTPLYTSFSGSATATANVSKAWITHGTKPVSGNYHFVVVPGVTPIEMKELATEFSKNIVYQILSQTNSFHAVKYLPDNLTSYAFFETRDDVNVGHVKSISNKALVGIRESGDSLIVTVANPDLNTVTVAEPTTKWKARSSTVNLKLNGGWKIAENEPNAVIDKQDNVFGATFTLTDGFSATIKLVKDESIVPLPILLTEFNGKKIEDGIQLNWNTVIETDIKHFQILKSTDGVNFSPIGSLVTAAGNSQTSKDYSFDDARAAIGEGKVYYRLKIVNIRNEETIHDKTITIELISPDKELKIVPNPVAENFELHYFSPANETVEIKIVNVEGKIILTKSVLVASGSNKIPLASSAFASGVYTLVIKSEKGIETIKLMKVK